MNPSISPNTASLEKNSTLIFLFIASLINFVVPITFIFQHISYSFAHISGPEIAAVKIRYDNPSNKSKLNFSQSCKSKYISAKSLLSNFTTLAILLQVSKCSIKNCAIYPVLPTIPMFTFYPS